MARDRYRRAARGNRLGLVIVGTLLLVAGAAALAVGQGLFGPGPAQTPLSSGPIAETLTQQWVPYVAVAVALVAGFLALRWLTVQGMNDTLSRLHLEQGDAGNVEMSESVARGAFEREVAEYPGVRRARARLTESNDRPHLRLALTLEEDADVARVWYRVREEALADLRTALELEQIPAVVRMSMTSPAKNAGRGLV
ncbi:hypothetical protein [Nocardiopsis alkaliphila]|uniref:hypothetical protein n=1 Tax=Nocardiopsis alkaliphila TaxID=225762 RepID=UPI00068642A9|nr:hypothetical protein [Nocardiopsis alkaliphila]